MATYFRFKGYTPISVLNAIVGDACPFQRRELPLFSERCTHLVKPGLLAGYPPREPFSGTNDFCSDAKIIPPAKPLQVLTVDRRTKRTRKEFRELQASGKVVISPRHVVDLSCTALPTPPPSTVFTPVNAPYPFYPSSAPYSAVPAFSQPGTYCGAFRPSALAMDEIAGIGLDGRVIVPSGNVRGEITTMQYGSRQYEQGIVHNLVTASDKTCYAAALAVYNAIESAEWDKGLITSVHAEANSGIWDVLTEAAEAKETISWIFGLLREAIELIITFKKEISRIHRQPGKSTAAIADEVASLWMQFRYAFSPIGYSVDDAMAYLEADFKPYQTFRKGSNIKLDVDLPSGWSIDDLEVRDRVFLKYRYAAGYALDGLGFNAVTTAWELTPLSFVVDWVLNIGDLLASLNTPQNVIDMGCSYSRQIKDEVRVKTPEGDVLINVNYYKLTPYNPLDRVGLSINPSMTWKRWLDAISLMWGGLRSTLK